MCVYMCVCVSDQPLSDHSLIEWILKINSKPTDKTQSS